MIYKSLNYDAKISFKFKIRNYFELKFQNLIG